MQFSFSLERCMNTQHCYANKYLLSNSDIGVGEVGSQNVLIKKQKTKPNKKPPTKTNKIKTTKTQNFIYNFGDLVLLN